MRRREVLALLGGALAPAPYAVLAQPSHRAVIGYLGLASAISHSARMNAFRAGLRDLGYSEGKMFSSSSVGLRGIVHRLPALAADLVRRNVDVIVTHAVPGALAAKHATSTIPIVISAIGDILDFDLISSLSRPGGNITGLTFFNPEPSAKRLELLKEALPNLAKAAVLLNFRQPCENGHPRRNPDSTAGALKIDLKTFEVAGPSELKRHFAAIAGQQVGAAMSTRPRC